MRILRTLHREFRKQQQMENNEIFRGKLNWIFLTKNP